MSTEVKQLILPFSVSSENRKQPFTKEMEMAALFCFSELERQKGGGLILKKPPEKTVFIAETHYPFWMVPRTTSSCLLFDGLGKISYSFNYKDILDAKAFTEDLTGHSESLRTYLTFLSDNRNYFGTFASDNSLPINGLITDPNILQEFATHIIGAMQVTAPSPATATLSSALDETVLTSAKQELENLKTTFKEDAVTLYSALKLLNKITNDFTRTLRGKVKAIEEEYGVLLKKQEEITTPKVNRLREDYDKRMKALSENYEKQLFPLQKDKAKLQKIEQQILLKIERYKAEAKTSAARKDTVSERKWKDKEKEGKKEHSDVRKRIEQAEQRIKETNDRKTLETFNLRSESETKINEARKDLLELEAARDAKTHVHKQEIERLKDLTSTIATQANTMAKTREAYIDALEKLGLPHKRKDYALVYMPTYVICYKSERKNRFIFIPPSVVNSIDLSVKLKGALGRARVKQILSPWFKATSSLLSMLPKHIEENAVLEREVIEEGEKANILRTESSLESVKNGLRQLKEEGWLSDKEYDAFVRALARSG